MNEPRPNYDLEPVAALDEQQRQQSPHIIFENLGTNPSDNLALRTVIDVMQGAGVPVVGDIDVDEASGIDRFVVRTIDLDRNERTALSALVLGATRVAHNSLNGDDPVNSMRAATETAVHQIAGNAKLAEEFKSYYSGLGWGFDQDKMISALFEYGTPYDEKLLDDALTIDSALYLIEELDPEFSWEERREWRDKTVAELLEAHPKFDYHKLKDPDFAASPEGEKLAVAYGEICGSIQTQRHKRHEVDVTAEGTIAARPIIPLSKFPIIEAIMVDEIALTKPKGKYNFGRSEVISLVVESDSLAAQEAIVDSVTTRLPREDRYVFDGPDEFTHKSNVISYLTRAYQIEADPERREQFKDMVLDVLDAYTEDGVMAREIRAEYLERGNDKLARDIKDIVKRILITGLASPDAEQFLVRAMPEAETDLTQGVDPLALSQADRITVILDALGKVDEKSQAVVFWRLAKSIFQDVTTADSIQTIAEMKIEAARQNNLPAVWLARKALRRFSFKLQNEAKDPEHLEAETNFSRLTANGEELARTAKQMTNGLVLDYLENMIVNDMVTEDYSENSKLFKELLARVSYGAMWKATELPAEYYSLIALAKSPKLADDLKSAVVWKLAEQTEHADESLRRLLPAAIIDGYEVLLGELGSLRLPSSRIRHGISALAFMAKSPYVFKHASEGQLLTLRQYNIEMRELVERYLTLSLPNADADLDQRSEQRELAHDLNYLLEDMNRIEDAYREYLYLEDVKQLPHVYYPWLMKNMMPFWHKMQWEVSPGNRPSRDVSQLYNVLKDHIDNKLVIKDDDYSEDFDVFNDGHLDTLLVEGYQRMIVPSDIQYVTTVWQDGRSFMFNAVLMMPESVVEQFKGKYGENAPIVAYIERTRTRFNKPEVE